MSEALTTDELRELEESLRMLPLPELEERLEVSPLILGDTTTDLVSRSCRDGLPICRMSTPSDPIVPGSTGPTNPDMG